MTAAPQIDVRDLKSVRRAARELAEAEGEEVLLGDDWVVPSPAELEMVGHRRRRGILSLHRSPLARKIITFNLMALIVLVSGMFFFAPAQDNLTFQRANGLVNEAELIADVFEAQIPAATPVNFVTGDGIDLRETMSGLSLRGGIEVYVFDPGGTLVGQAIGPDTTPPVLGLEAEESDAVITNGLTRIWDGISGIFSPIDGSDSQFNAQDNARDITGKVLNGQSVVETGVNARGETVFVVGTPIEQNGRVVGVLAITSAAGEVDALARQQRELILQMFLVGIVLSLFLSLILASTIANPIAELAAAAELGRDRNARNMAPDRIRTPDLTARPDEIGRLSGALRGLVSALYERIEGNEQFAADVSHEIKNPLASLRSAVGTLHVAKRDDQRAKLIEVIEHDIQRLDRLVTDISAASRLDSELVREQEETFDLLKMLRNLNEFLGKEAASKGVELIADLPAHPIRIQGLEGRLAQVFVNLITNAISFCGEGDAIRVWARMRENRVLVVVEDTGPGIPDDALGKVFQRFYSERPADDFGNNSGLGLAISKQIIEAHGGVIWAENIRPTDADMSIKPLGARFVVGLPV